MGTKQSAALARLEAIDVAGATRADSEWMEQALVHALAALEEIGNMDEGSAELAAADTAQSAFAAIDRLARDCE